MTTNDKTPMTPTNQPTPVDEPDAAAERPHRDASIGTLAGAGETNPAPPDVTPDADADADADARPDAKPPAEESALESLGRAVFAPIFGAAEPDEKKL